MIDMEKVKKGVWQCLFPSTEEEYATQCYDCPYYEPGITLEECMTALRTDALALLKGQEAKNVINMTLSKDCFLIASCPKCNALLTRGEHKNYCGYCGQAVKWDA